MGKIYDFFGYKNSKEISEEDKAILSLINVLTTISGKYDELYGNLMELSLDQRKEFHKHRNLVDENINQINHSLKQLKNLLPKLVEKYENIEKLISGLFKDFKFELKFDSHFIAFEKGLEKNQKRIENIIDGLRNYLRKKEKSQEFKKAA